MINSLSMYLELRPLELKLTAKVTLEVRLPWGIRFTKTLFSGTLWRYKSPSINAKIIDNKKKEEDTSPPQISPVTDSGGNGKVKFYTSPPILVKF